MSSSVLSGLRIAKAPAKPGAPVLGCDAVFPHPGIGWRQPGGLCLAGQAPRAGRAPRKAAALAGRGSWKSGGQRGQSPEAAEECGCSWRVGNRFISPILP